MAMTAPITALYAKALGASDGVAALVVSAMSLSFLCVDLVGSHVVPRVDARSALVGGYLVFGAGSFVSAVAPNLTVMVGARVLQGFAAAFPMGAGFHVALRLAGPRRQGREIARFNASSFLGLTFGPLIVGAVAGIRGGTQGMRWGFAVCGVVNVATAVIARMAVPAIPSEQPRKLGLPSRAVFAGTRTRKALLAAGLGFGLRGVAGMTLLPLLGDQMDAGTSGVALATFCMSVAELGGIVLSGRLADSIGRKPIVAGSAALSAVTLSVLLATPSIPSYFALSAVLGFGLAALRVVPAAMVVDVAESDEAAAVGWRVACDVSSLITAVTVSLAIATSGLPGGFASVAGLAVAIGLLARSLGETRPAWTDAPSEVAPVGTAAAAGASAVGERHAAPPRGPAAPHGDGAYGGEERVLIVTRGHGACP